MKPLIRTYSPVASIFVAFTLAGASAVHAANDVWIGNTDANFGTLSNWTGSVSPNNNTPVFGVAGTSGTTLNNDIVGATYVGLTFNSGASAYTIGGNSFTLTGNIANNSSSLQTINNDMTSTAGRTFTGGTGGLTLGGTYTTTVAATYAGIVNLTGANTINGGAVANQGFATVGNNNSATVTISNGGSLTVNGTTNATKPGTIIGQNTNGVGILNVGATNGSTSGTFTVSGDTGFMLGNLGAGTLNIYSGTATINRGTTATTTNTADTRLIMLGRDSNTATGTINLNGGTLATDRQFVRDGSSSAGAGTANFVFNGGTLKALANQTDWLQSTTATSEGQNLGASGGTVNTNALALSSVTTTATSTIDSNGFSVAINNNISGAGGFNITSSTGTGTVTFGGASTYTGATTIGSGTFALSASGSINNTSGVSLGTSGTFDVSAKVGGYTVNNLSGSGTVIGNLSVSTQLAIGNSPGTVNFNGDLTLASGSTYLYELTGGGTAADLGDVSGSLTLTGSLLDLVQLGTYTEGDKFTLFAYDGALTDTFSGLADDTTFTDAGGEWLINYNDTTAGLNGGTGNSFVTVTAVPEPAAALLGGLGLLGLLRRRRVA